MDMNKAKGMLGDAKDKLEDLKDEHGDKVAGALDKAKDFITDKTPDSIDDKIEGAVDKAKDFLAKDDGDAA